MDYLNLNSEDKLKQYEFFKNSMFNPDQIQITYNSTDINPTGVSFKPFDLPGITPLHFDNSALTAPVVKDNEPVKSEDVKEDTKQQEGSASFDDAIQEMRNGFSNQLNSYLESIKVKNEQPVEEGEVEAEPTNIPSNVKLTEDMSNYKGYKGPADYQEVVKRLGYAESQHNYGAVFARTNRNGTVGSGAWGRYQMIWSIFKDDIKRVTGVTNPVNFLKNPEAQDKFFLHYYNTTLLPGMRKFKKKNPNSGLTDLQIIEGLHFQGTDGFNKAYDNKEFSTKKIGLNPTIATRLYKNYTNAELNAKPKLSIPQSQLKYFKQYL